MTGGGFFAGQQRSRACAEVFADSRGECWAAFPAHPEPGGNCAAAPSAALRAIRALPSCARGVRGETGYGGSAKGFWLPLHLQVRGGEEGPVLAALRPLGCSCAVSEQSPSVGSAGAQVTPGKGPPVGRRRGGNSFPLSSMGPGIAASDSHRAAVNS